MEIPKQVQKFMEYYGMNGADVIVTSGKRTVYSLYIKTKKDEPSTPTGRPIFVEWKNDTARVLPWNECIKIMATMKKK